MEVSHMMGAEDPTLVVGNETCWRVPVHLSTPQRGIVGQVGFVDINAGNGELLDSAQNKMLLEQQARAIMVTQPSFQGKRTVQEAPIAYDVPRAPKITLDENDLPIVTPAITKK